MKKECRTTAHSNTTLSDSSLTSSLISEPGNIHSYFKKEAFTLTIVTVSGILYNVGLLAGPYFQGKLLDSLHDNKPLSTVITVALIFIAFIIATQVFRSVKRFYVRRFANNTLKSMRTVLYHAILSKQLRELEQENTGSLMAKATGDVDACVEGMRKFTTEIFDTGVFMVSYLVMMFTYDVKLTLVATVFIALALFVAELVKKPVYSLTSAWRKSASELNGRTYELTDAAMMNRIYGRDKSNAESYDKLLSQYSKKAVKATVSENAMEPLYSIIVMVASVFIIVFGAKNVTSTFWTVGRFSAYLSLFAGLAGKASHAGKLFNSVQKATVSWKRIKPYLSQASDNSTIMQSSNQFSLQRETTTPIAEIHNVSFSFKDKPPLFSNVSCTCHPGTITGITGPVACGKSVFAHLFLGSDGPQSYDGSTLTGTISIFGKKIEALSAAERAGTIGVMFHDSSLFSGTIYDNITIGREASASNTNAVLQALDTVCFDKDIAEMKEGLQTVVGNGGIRLSGGQQSRIALARALYGKPSLLILDDPFAAVDPATERQILLNIRTLQEKQKAEGSIPFAVVLISHRLQVFNTLDSVILFNEGNSAPLCGTHDELLSSSALYRSLCAEQEVTE